MGLDPTTVVVAGYPSTLRVVAGMLLMCVRDGANLLVIEPDPTPNVDSALATYRIGQTQYQLVPPPMRVLAAIERHIAGYVLHRLSLSDGWLGVIPTDLGGESADVVVVVRESARGPGYTFSVPTVEGWQTVANEALTRWLGDRGCVEFEFDE
jgi:hypothetical protein